ncbi:MAG: SDR family NAD(P)-dependent oxidoreductase [Solirubrobacterales bacterium]|nr:SDR family NAD(P)-dependent oxidoreductase [Solirubrobacterales bacterium]
MGSSSPHGRAALGTGASRGIGAAIATALDRAGARVALAARDRARLQEVAATLGHDPVVLETELSDPAARLRSPPRRKPASARSTSSSTTPASAPASRSPRSTPSSSTASTRSTCGPRCC